MKTFEVYKGLKTQLQSILPVFRFMGQYIPGKENISYIAPVIYIEMPKTMKVDYLPGGVKIARDSEIRVHLVTNAPFKSHDNSSQDTAITDHELKESDLMELLEGLKITNHQGNIIATSLIHSGSESMKYHATCAVSIFTYKTEIRDYSTKKYFST